MFGGEWQGTMALTSPGGSSLAISPRRGPRTGGYKIKDRRFFHLRRRPAAWTRRSCSCWQNKVPRRESRDLLFIVPQKRMEGAIVPTTEHAGIYHNWATWERHHPAEHGGERRLPGYWWGSRTGGFSTCADDERGRRRGPGRRHRLGGLLRSRSTPAAASGKKGEQQRSTQRDPDISTGLNGCSSSRERSWKEPWSLILQCALLCGPGPGLTGRRGKTNCAGLLTPWPDLSSEMGIFGQRRAADPGRIRVLAMSFPGTVLPRRPDPSHPRGDHGIRESPSWAGM